MSRYRNNIIDLTGQKFGRWTVLSRVDKERRGSSHWYCRCDCGTEKILRSNTLRGNESLSCGCRQKEIASNLGKSKAVHSKSGTRIYSLWKSIRQRCYNNNHNQYKNYGGRGIKVCDRWLESFENFLEDMGDNIPEGMTLDRINVNGDYSLNNCRWISMKEQQNNRTNNVLIEFNGEKLTISQWSEKLGIKYITLYDRLITRGWSVEKSLTTPLFGKTLKKD